MLKNKNIFLLDSYRKIGRKIHFYEFFKYPELRFLRIFRKANYYYKNNNKFFCFIYKIKLQILINKYSYNIPFNSNIGKGFVISHHGPIIINHMAIIGDNCNISSGVVIGQENRGTRMGVPEIGNEVWIGANAVVVGKIKIGNNVLIAPNSYVNFDVPNNSIVIGNPGVIYPNRIDATNKYIERKI